MILGKMFPVCCYRGEAGWRTRLALSLGMCPRGEVGAGVIVISISMGISGPAITVAVMALTVNLVCSSLFIASVVKLSSTDPQSPERRKPTLAKRPSWGVGDGVSIESGICGAPEDEEGKKEKHVAGERGVHARLDADADDVQITVHVETTDDIQ